MPIICALWSDLIYPSGIWAEEITIPVGECKDLTDDQFNRVRRNCQQWTDFEITEPATADELDAQKCCLQPSVPVAGADDVPWLAPNPNWPYPLTQVVDGIECLVGFVFPDWSSEYYPPKPELNQTYGDATGTSISTAGNPVDAPASKDDWDSHTECHDDGVAEYLCEWGAWVLKFAKSNLNEKTTYETVTDEIDFDNVPATPANHPADANDGDQHEVNWPNGDIVYELQNWVWVIVDTDEDTIDTTHYHNSESWDRDQASNAPLNPPADIIDWDTLTEIYDNFCVYWSYTWGAWIKGDAVPKVDPTKKTLTDADLATAWSPVASDFVNYIANNWPFDDSSLLCYVWDWDVNNPDYVYEVVDWQPICQKVPTWNSWRVTIVKESWVVISNPSSPANAPAWKTDWDVHIEQFDNCEIRWTCSWWARSLSTVTALGWTDEDNRVYRADQKPWCILHRTLHSNWSLHSWSVWSDCLMVSNMDSDQVSVNWVTTNHTKTVLSATNWTTTWNNSVTSWVNSTTTWPNSFTTGVNSTGAWNASITYWANSTNNGTWNSTGWNNNLNDWNYNEQNGTWNIILSWSQQNQQIGTVNTMWWDRIFQWGWANTNDAQSQDWVQAGLSSDVINWQRFLQIARTSVMENTEWSAQIWVNLLIQNSTFATQLSQTESNITVESNRSFQIWWQTNDIVWNIMSGQLATERSMIVNTVGAANPHNNIQIWWHDNIIDWSNDSGQFVSTNSTIIGAWWAEDFNLFQLGSNLNTVDWSGWAVTRAGSIGWENITVLHNDSITIGNVDNSVWFSTLEARVVYIERPSFHNLAWAPWLPWRVWVDATWVLHLSP